MMMTVLDKIKETAFRERMIAMRHNETGETNIPLIDREIPAVTETAVFALG
jgi:hypothetical protein